MESFESSTEKMLEYEIDKERKNFVKVYDNFMTANSINKVEYLKLLGALLGLANCSRQNRKKIKRK